MEGVSENRRLQPPLERKEHRKLYGMSSLTTATRRPNRCPQVAETSHQTFLRKRGLVRDAGQNRARVLVSLQIPLHGRTKNTQLVRPPILPLSRRNPLFKWRPAWLSTNTRFTENTVPCLNLDMRYFSVLCALAAEIPKLHNGLLLDLSRKVFGYVQGGRSCRPTLRRNCRFSWKSKLSHRNDVVLLLNLPLLNQRIALTQKGVA